ncbi:WAT1-related protein At1g68170-like [Tasmannia lanceolata]|uniref:WAT1-related protein At1g68170-like n=1 Tax=Tasmannia lanceolata TaxID=3420 RepID=UPI0040629333
MAFGDFLTCLHGMRPVVLMVVVQILLAGLNIFYKFAVIDGMSLRILIAYRYVFATAILAPLAFFLGRNNRPILTWTLLLQGFCCGFFGATLVGNLYLWSLSMTSATFVSAMLNFIPVITFIMAVSVGLERLGTQTMYGKAKVIGTLISVGGAMLMTLYKGVEIHLWSSNTNLVGHHQQKSSPQGSGNHVMGSLMAVASCVSYGIWYIIQPKMTETCPCHYSSATLMCLMASIQSAIFALCTERDWTQWKLGWNIRLLTAFYSGSFGTALLVTLTAWCIKERGPLFASTFMPLTLIIVAVVGSLILDEKLHLGSVLGAVLILIGLYLVLWGKGREMEKTPEASIEVVVAETPATETGILGAPQAHSQSG